MYGNALSKDIFLIIYMQYTKKVTLLGALASRSYFIG